MIVVTNPDSGWQESLLDATVVDAETMTFIAPDSAFNDDGTDAFDNDGWGQTVTVEVYYQQVLASAVAENGHHEIYTNGVESVLHYHYGGIVYYADGATVNGAPASSRGSSGSYLHQGITLSLPENNLERELFCVCLLNLC